MRFIEQVLVCTLVSVLSTLAAKFELIPNERYKCMFAYLICMVLIFVPTFFWERMQAKRHRRLSQYFVCNLLVCGIQFVIGLILFFTSKNLLFTWTYVYTKLFKVFYFGDITSYCMWFALYFALIFLAPSKNTYKYGISRLKYKRKHTKTDELSDDKQLKPKKEQAKSDELNDN